MVASFAGMKIRQIAAAVAGGLKFPAYPGLPFQQDDLIICIFCSSQSSRHTGCTAANDSDNHTVSFPRIYA